MTIPIPVAPDRPDVQPPGADDHAWYEAWLDFHRRTLLWKCSGLTAEQLCLRAVPTSTLSLLGLVRHLTDVERGWFARTLENRTVAEVPPLYWDDEDEDGDLTRTDPARAADDVAAYEGEVAAAKAIAARHALTDVGTHRKHGSFTLRWIYQHMLEEYARHNGHADLLREAIDGAKGE